MNQTRIKNNDLGYLGNPNIKRDGVEQAWSSEEIREYAKCMKDPVYFAKTYLKVISLDQGLVDFNLYPYQEDMDAASDVPLTSESETTNSS